MTIGIIHQDLENQEIELKNAFSRHGIESKLYDIRKTSIEELQKNKLIINRVFASVANRNYLDNIKTLDYLQKLENEGIQSINSHFTTKCDYSKYFSSKIMEDNGIKNPKTFLVNEPSHINSALEFYEEIGKSKGKPIVVKRDMGGRGHDIHLIENSKSLEKILNSNLNNELYKGGYVVQEFVESILPYDFRVSIINDQIIYSMGRSLLDTNEKYNWISSMSLGSKEIPLNLPKEVEEIALNSTKSIGAFFNDVDIIMTKDGPYVIENNPTPNFAKRTQPSEKQKMVIYNLVKKIKNHLN